MALTRISSGGIAEGVVIKFDQNNTPTAPAIGFEGVGNGGTGIYSPAVNELAIATSGQPRLTFKSDGKIVTGNGTILGGTNPDFLGAKNITLYVNQSDLNATDDEVNDGGNLNRPFKTIERALLEAARKSYKPSEPDKFEAFTIMVMPGQYEIDNRPGYDIRTNPLTAGTTVTVDNGLFRFNPRNGGVIVPRGTSIVGYDLRKTVIRPKYVPKPSTTTTSEDGSILNDGYVLSHVMYDGATMIERNRGYIQEQTKLYLAATQAGYQSLTDAKKELCVRDIGYFIDAVIKDLREGGNENTFINAEYYIDGNGGYKDQFLNAGDGNLTAEVTATQNAFTRAALLMRYAVENSWGAYTEYTTAQGKTISRTTFSAGNGYLTNGDCSTVSSAVNVLGQLAVGILGAPNTYTETYKKTQGVFKQTSIFKVTGGCYFWQMTFKDAIGTPYNAATFDGSGIPTFTTAADANYSHHKVVAFTYADQRTTDGELDQYYKKIDAWDQTFDSAGTRDVRPEEYTIVGDGSTNATIDTVNSCSPYIFNCSLRSVFGMCGMHTDGSKVAEKSFKSMVVAQFTGISLQKDANAFFQPKDLEGDKDNALYNDDNAATAIPPIYADPDAQYKHDWRHFHIKASNGGFIQVVSVFAVGYADQFLAESGGDMSITNSNSNFGQISLRAKGSQFNSFKPASQGKITAIIPPRGISSRATDITFYNIDSENTWEKMGQADNLFVPSRLSQYSSSADSLRLYLEISNFSSEGDIPELVVEAPDYSQTPDVNGNYPTVTKRYLTFGTTNQYALFRDFYNTTGTTDAAYRYISTKVEGTDGTSVNYSAKVNFTATSAENSIGNNNARQGYFWDPIKSAVYIKLDGSDSQTKQFLSGFIFATKTEEVFSFVEDIADDGSITTKFVSTQQNVLIYKDGFPAGLTITKNEDTRGSTPADLLWRVEYTIPKDCPEIPKPPEKRFIIKGIRPGNGEDGIPYSDYRFMVWDVEEYLTWDRNVRDGVYYLTLIRADVNKFTDGFDNAVTKVVRRPTAISAGSSFACSFIEEINNYDKDTRLVSNVNYLYPSVNEEGPTYDVRRIWNPPQADSRVLVEKIGAGTRVKDLTVPNYTRYKGGSTPFKDIPAMYSVTAEAVHRLVQAFDLRYAQASTRSTANIAVSPVVSWDDRSGLTSIGYQTSVDIYGPSSTYRIGKDKETRTIQTNVNAVDYNPSLNVNLYGIVGDATERRIIVCNSTKATFTTAEISNYTIGQTLPLYRPSILRASSHTWEYIGLGSGNYSTGFPQLQTRVLKPYEQYIAQGYENAGGFVASSGTNSNGDFYIGTQIIQAGGSSTVSLNVPKVRKSSESNYVEIENIENRISNSVVNVTASTAGKSGSAQSAIKALSNFFNAEKLSVSNIATINSLIVQEKLYISNASINNAAFFPEANTNAYGFVKGAKPEKTGFISTDTNDKLYVSPKFLDAWRVKRQLISASAVTLDNNRIYLEPYTQALVDSYDPASGSYEGLSLADIQTKVTNNQEIRLYLKETSGLPSYGSIDLEMSLQYVDLTDYKLSSGSRSYLNPKLSLTLKYDEIDYTENYVVVSKYQNNFPIVDYIKSCVGTSEYNQIIKSYTGFLTNGEKGIDASEGDIKYLTAKLSSNVSVDTIGSPIPSDSGTYKNISITTTAAEWAKWPNRGAISLREYERGWTANQYRVSTYVYFKSTTQGTFTLIKKVGDGTLNDAGYTYRAAYDNKYPGIDDKNVFFAGCNTIVSFSDRWASESPFIPPLDPTKGSVEDVNIEEATLYEIPVKSVPSAVDINDDYITQNLPNPFSSKALGVNIQNRTAVKKFAPLSYFKQVQSWCDNSGFNPNDEIELLMKPGYYKLDGSVFPCKIKINGSGLAKSSVFAGKEQTGMSAGRMGGYLEDSVKRGDSIYLYRAPTFQDQYGFGNDAITVNISGGLTSTGGFNLTNVHFLGLNEAVTKNEISDTLYSGDENVVNARRLVRKAYYTKSFIKKYYNTKVADGVDGALAFTANPSVSVGQQKAELQWIVNSDNVINGDIASANYGELNTAISSNSRYMVVRLKASNFSADATARRNFALARKYIIPGTTLYWLDTGNSVSITSKSTKVISVRRINQTNATTWGSDSTEELHVMVSIYRTPGSPNYQGNLSSRTNLIEDLDISGYSSGDKKLVFLNEDGAEFTTLTYNWALNRRRNFLPKGFVHEGGYQPAIIRRVTSQVTPGGGTAGVTITLDNTDLLRVGDRIVGAGIQSGTRIASISGNNIVTSDNISDTIAAKTPLSFTQYNDFGDEFTKYDVPEIFGLTRSSDNSYISIIIDRNPNVSIDPSIKPYQYGAGSFSLYPTMLVQSKTNHSSITTQYASPEDCAYAIPRARSYSKRVSGFQEERFVVIDINPNSIADLASINPANPSTSSLSSYVENAGISADLMKEFGLYTPNIFSFGGGVGTGFTSSTITFGGETATTAIKAKLEAAITNGGRKYNGYASVILTPQAGATGGTGYRVTPRIDTVGGVGTIIGFNVSTVGTTQVAFNGNWTISVTDRKGYILSPTGRTVDLNSTRLDGDDFTFVAKANMFAAVRVSGNGNVSLGSPYLEDYTTDSFGDIDVLTARGKKIYCSWPQSYRALRRRFPSAPGSGSSAVNGNYQSSLIDVNAIPGSNFDLNLTGVTIGAQSPASEAANTFGGGYRGGLIRCRGSKLTLSGTRFRGNLSLDWTGLLSNTTSRAGGLFIAGHSIEMFQMEDQNSFDRIGGSNPAKHITTSKEDEEFRKITEYDPLSNVFLEPSKDPYGQLSDGDSRTFPISTNQAIRRYNLNPNTVTAWDGTTIPSGSLQTKLSLFERYQAPYPLYYDNTITTSPTTITSDANGNKYVELSGGIKSSGIRLRWNNSSSTTVSTGTTVTSGTLATLPPKTLTFLYPADTDSGQDLVNNIFFGSNATKIVKTTNIETIYATVTRLATFNDRFDKDGVPTTNGAYKLARITYSGNIPSEVSAANGSNIQINTRYLDSKRYNYVSTVTSRYQKTVVNKSSRLILATDNNVNTFAEHADLSIGSGTVTANQSRATILTLRNLTDATAIDGKVRMQTDSSGRILNLDILDYGSGHKEGAKLAIFNGATNLTSNIEIVARRNLDIDLQVLGDSEYMAVLPQNCFILNGVNQPSPTAIKQKLLAARTIFKPGSYILLNNTYYRIANSDTTNSKPYLGIYKYINTSNLSDQRADIVVMLEDPEYAPAYAANTRVDLFDYDNILDYWPTSGRMVIGNRETCDFIKSGDPTSNTGYELRLSRSMTKYWPHYIRDWEGLDPNDSTDATVTLSSLESTILRLADPVDVTCYGLRRVFPSDNASTQSFATATVPEYVSPTGIVSNKIAKVSIASDNVDNDFQKLSIGQPVTIPYKNIADTYNWSGCVVTVGDAQYAPGASNSTNRAGDRVISGTITISTGTFDTRSSRTFNIFGSSSSNIAPYQYVNPLTCARFSNPRGDTYRIGSGGFVSWNYMWTPVYENANAGQATIKINPAYLSSTYRLGSDCVFTATITEIDNTTDPNERLITVTGVASGALYKGAPIRTGGTVGSGTLIGYVVGFDGDSINESGAYEDSTDLTGTGNTGVYRLQIVSGATIPTGSQTFNGQKSANPDYMVWMRNHSYWSRTIVSKSVDPITRVATITLNANLNDPNANDENPNTTSVFAGDWVLWYYQSFTDNSVRLLLDKSLTNSIPEGTQLSMAPCNHQSEGAYGEAGIRETNGFVFKSKILDIEKDTNKINIYFADDYPENWSNSQMRSFGLMYVNSGGWTYPKTGGSSFRANNAILTAPDANGVGTTIQLPNRSARIQAGDILSYTWEDELVVESTSHAGGTISITSNTSTITTSADQRSYIFPGAVIYDSSSNLVGTVSSVSSTSISLTSNYTGTTITTQSGWRYTSTGRTFTFSSQIANAVTSNGIATCTLESANQYQILHTGFALGNRKLWLSIDEIFVSHREGNFTNDGPVVKKFIYTDTGVKLTFGDYRIWYENYSNYIRAGTEPGGQEISGRQGWVGNFGLTNSGERAKGLVMNGASSVQWGRQYQNSMWLTAVPVHAIWESVGYAPYMIQINTGSAGIESNYAFNTLTSYDNLGRFKFNALNHTSLSTGSIYAGLNHGAYVSGGGESYDTKQYQFASSARLKYNLQNGTVSGTGTVAGGNTSRLSEQYVVDRIVHYKPSLNVAASAVTSAISITYTNGSTTVSGTEIGNTVLPGDVLYSANTPSATNKIGIVRTVATDGNSVTLATAFSGTGATTSTWSYISPRVKHAGTSNAPSLALVFSGGGSTSTTDINAVGNYGFNVTANTAPGYNRYNYRFNINRRTFNQTVLLNTYDELLATKTIDDANKVIDINLGDLPVYRSPLMNVEVTRLNAKTHIEQSISVVGVQANI